MKNILFLVTGMTPQIITETVWALACDPNNDKKWIPDEIHILTTEHGFNLINTRLLDKGVFEKFKMDYPTLKNIKFDRSYITIVHHDGKNLTDLKTPHDNEMSADLICEKVRQFTQDDNVCLHISIAGGRKTMGFYAGYALSLYGRSQDKMSHILVEENFENVPDFYYPTPDNFEIIHDKGHSLNAKNAKVWLADIPFVRMRSYIPEKSLLAQSGFIDVVNAINLANKPLMVTINELDKTVAIGDKLCKLAPREFAFYLWFLQNKKQGLHGIARPKEGVPYDGADEFWAIYESLGKKQGKTIFDHDYFDQRRTALHDKLQSIFGIDVVNKIGVDKMNDGLYECILSPTQIVIQEI